MAHPDIRGGGGGGPENIFFLRVCSLSDIMDKICIVILVQGIPIFCAAWSDRDSVLYH